jgi:hypothetical protein
MALSLVQYVRNAQPVTDSTQQQQKINKNENKKREQPERNELA